MLCTSSSRLLAAVLCVALVVATGCTGVDASDRVEAAVREYNRQLVRAFAEADMNALSTVATRDQAYTEYYQMAALSESGVALHATLVGIDFGDIDVSGDASATATTVETWDYAHVSLDTSETVREENGVVYHLRYDLILQGGRWLVDRVISLDATTSSPASGE